MGNGFFLTVKQPGCEVDHSPPYEAAIKNEWSYISAPPIHLYGMDGKHFSCLGDCSEGDNSIYWLLSIILQMG
jgi:hypothetical protein